MLTGSPSKGTLAPVTFECEHLHVAAVLETGDGTVKAGPSLCTGRRHREGAAGRAPRANGRERCVVTTRPLATMRVCSRMTGDPGAGPHLWFVQN